MRRPPRSALVLLGVALVFSVGGFFAAWSTIQDLLPVPAGVVLVVLGYVVAAVAAVKLVVMASRVRHDDRT